MCIVLCDQFLLVINYKVFSYFLFRLFEQNSVLNEQIKKSGLRNCTISKDNDLSKLF